MPERAPITAGIVEKVQGMSPLQQFLVGAVIGLIPVAGMWYAIDPLDWF